jgi:hypothetical protein
MRQPRSSSSTPTVAILGPNTLVEDILARLLRREGYSTRHLDSSYPTGPTDTLLDGVDILLLAPGLKDGVCEGFLEAMRRTPQTADIPVLSLSSALKQALLDELSANLCWRILLKELVQELEDALPGGAVASTEALAVDGEEAV